MPTKNIALWKRITGYAAFSIFALLISFLLTFNYDLFGERLKQEADNNGWYLTFTSVGPGFFSVKAKGLKITKKLAPGQEAAPEPLVVDSISVRPTLLPPGVKVSGDAFDGSFGFSVNGFALLEMAMAGKPFAITGDDTRALLTAMLKSVKSVVSQFGRIRMTENAENAAIMFWMVLHG